MAWTAPRTWVALETVTAAIMNAHIRDNMLETEAATALEAGDLVYADAANSMGSRLSIIPSGASGDTASLVSDGSAPTWRRAGYVTGNGEAANGLYEFDGQTTTFQPLFGTFAGPFGGDPIMLNITTGTQALVAFGCRFAQHPTAGVNVQLSVAVNGFDAASFSTAIGTAAESDPSGNLLPHFRMHLFTGLTAGATQQFFLGAQCGAGGGAGSFARISRPWLMVQAL